MTRFVGSKAASGAAEQIVSILPAHRVFVELFAGRAAVTKRKIGDGTATTLLIEKDRPTWMELCVEFSNLSPPLVVWELPSFDLSPVPLERCRRKFVELIETNWKGLGILRGDAFEVLPYLAYLQKDICVYCDPPYLKSALRSGPRDYYAHTWDEEQHIDFLRAIRRATCHVIVSGYDSGLYNEELHDWKSHTFSVGTHAGRAIEKLWFNYDASEVDLHDTRFAGASFTDRQRIKRKAARWVRMLEAMPAAERQHVLRAIADYARGRSAWLPPSIRSQSEAHLCEGKDDEQHNATK